MNEFNSEELQTITKALDFYKYEMNKTDDMNEYRAWKSTKNKFNERLEFHHGEWSWKGNEE